MDKKCEKCGGSGIIETARVVTTQINATELDVALKEEKTLCECGAAANHEGKQGTTKIGGVVEWQFKQEPEPQSYVDFWYDLVEGKYIQLDQILADADQIKKLREAIAFIEGFREAGEKRNLFAEI